MLWRQRRLGCRLRGNAGFFCETFASFWGLFFHLDICFLSTLWQIPQTITNIPRCLPQILTLPKFCYHLAHSFSRKNVPFDFERGLFERSWGRPPKAKRHIFPKKRSSRSDTKTPGTDKSLLSPRKYSWRLVAFVKVWEWAREKGENFPFLRTKIKPGVMWFFSPSLRKSFLSSSHYFHQCEPSIIHIILLSSRGK